MEVDDEQYSSCPTCGVNWEDHPKEHCDEGRLIELIKPRFYLMDLDNYTDDFLREIIRWMYRKIKHLEKNK